MVNWRWFKAASPEANNERHYRLCAPVSPCTSRLMWQFTAGQILLLPKCKTYNTPQISWPLKTFPWFLILSMPAIPLPHGDHHQAADKSGMNPSPYHMGLSWNGALLNPMVYQSLPHWNCHDWGYTSSTNPESHMIILIGLDPSLCIGHPYALECIGACDWFEMCFVIVGGYLHQYIGIMLLASSVATFSTVRWFFYTALVHLRMLHCSSASISALPPQCWASFRLKSRWDLHQQIGTKVAKEGSNTATAFPAQESSRSMVLETTQAWACSTYQIQRRSCRHLRTRCCIPLTCLIIYKPR